MNLLAIDTSSENVSLAVMWKDRVVVDFNRKMRFGASKVIVCIDAYIRKLSVNLEKIDAFIIGRGPGSFTGLRISFSIVKALNVALGKPVISIGSFLTCALPFRKKEKIAVISDARRKLIYAASFKANRDTLRLEGKEKLMSLEEFVQKKRNYFFVSYDNALREQSLARFPDIDFFQKDVYPNAKSLLLLAQDYFCNNIFTPLDKLEPLYIYPKTCQIRRKNV
ncbi:MAG: tRNA (adenosine(37)-N6)-threonylcarbamoyltransferase complex dimerization subunit type 1 TsaB [Candidatus Omnitrophota bacterium]|nr:MAG: tRNA (adenosine(37)-N6)-threonylcarbamoyltransferase complex dimerization subunit type 1 TsaB [Candidatus Omnitrophota bacterium]